MNRDSFRILENNIIYFDSSATSLKPNCVIDKINDFYSNYSANTHSVDYDNAYRCNVEYEGVRDKVASFLNASKDEIAFTKNTTEAINIIANGLSLNENDEVLVSYSEHASNILPWFNTKAKVVFIPLDNGKITISNIQKMITKNTKVISLAHATNVLGDIRDIKSISKLAKDNNIISVIDAAQSISHIKVDVKDIDCDYLVFSAHKCYGPFGVGILYGKESSLDKLKLYNLGGGMNESFESKDEVILKPSPYKFDAGTPNIEGVIAFGESIDFINKIGINKISEYERDLTSYLIDKLSKIDHIKLLNNNPDVPVISFNVDNIFAQDVAQYLNKYHICVRAGNHCAKLLYKEIGVKSSIRVSLSLFNTYEELDRLVELLSDKDRILREMI